MKAKCLRINPFIIPLREKGFYSIRAKRFYTSERIFNNKEPDYSHMLSRLTSNRKGVSHPLTLSEKIMLAHLADGEKYERGVGYLKLVPDRVAMQDASAQMAILQFMNSGRENAAVPASIHCDHLIQAHDGEEEDLKNSIKENKEILDFFEQCSDKYGIELWKAGSGIIHQIVFENYASPGTLLLGTDSHTPNAGGMGMLAIGVGGADAVDALSGVLWELKAPKFCGINLTGKLQNWASPKDVILKLAGIMTVEGATNYIVEYFGPGVETISCTGMATICNMGAEIGATTSIFPYTNATGRYLRSTNRGKLCEAAEYARDLGYLRADPGCAYDKVIEINLSEIEPCINGPFTPDLSTPISKFKDFVRENKWEDVISAALVGSCTNSSYEDITKSISIIDQARARNLRPKTNFLVALGSDKIHSTINKYNQDKKLAQIGATTLANACGPCIGQWKRKDIKQDKTNAILTTFNRNFRARNDGFSKTMNFLASPEIVTAMSFSGKLTFNPLTDYLIDDKGESFKFEPPKSQELPPNGFSEGDPSLSCIEKPLPNPSVNIIIDKNSDRLQKIEPFPAWDGKEITDMRVLVKVKGKCTTDHISAAGKWLKYKGHLENISNNTLIGAPNSFTNEVNLAKNHLNQKLDTIPNVAKSYKQNNIHWMIVAENNYGEGSAREHAALQPRFLGCRVILSKSFARIHENNLKKQGILPVTFTNKNDWDLIPEDCTVSTIGLPEISPSSELKLRIKPLGKEEFDITVTHTLSSDQILWFKHGSALNLLSSLNREK